MTYRVGEDRLGLKARWFWVGALGLLLAACGGAENGGSDAVLTRSSTLSDAASPAATRTEKLLAEGAKINTAELAQAQEEAPTDTSSTASVAASKATTKAASISATTAYRFYNKLTGAHFYTISTTERDNIKATLPQFQFEGAAFSVSAVSGEGLSPVYRFFNDQTGVHFFTISANEKEGIESSLPQFKYEGIAYYASKLSGAGFKPLYRFYLTAKGFHFYTVSEAEKDNVIKTLPGYTFENIGYYVLDTSNVATTVLKLPHSGISDQHCYQAGSDDLVLCSSAGALTLNSQQDGHRSAVNPMSYSEVAKSGGGTYDKTECVKDNVTGLIWEGKTVTGLRAGSNVYTHFDNTALLQRSNGSGGYTTPSLAQIDATSNSVGYTRYVNAIALCGYTNWRLPTADELIGIVDFDKAYPAGLINVTWFPNTNIDRHWTGSPSRRGDFLAWQGEFFSGHTITYYREVAASIRLVRP